MFSCSAENIAVKKKGKRKEDCLMLCTARQKARRGWGGREGATCPSHLSKASGYNVKEVETALYGKLEVEGNAPRSTLRLGLYNTLNEYSHGSLAL